MIEEKEAYIAYLEEEISYSEQVVAIFKAALEAAINNAGGVTEEPETPSEEQPAA